MKVHICLQMHSLSIFLNQVLQHAFEGFRPVSRLHLVCQFSNSVDRSVEKTLGSNGVVLGQGDGKLLFYVNGSR